MYDVYRMIAFQLQRCYGTPAGLANGPTLHKERREGRKCFISIITVDLLVSFSKLFVMELPERGVSFFLFQMCCVFFPYEMKECTTEHIFFCDPEIGKGEDSLHVRPTERLRLLHEANIFLVRW